MHGVCNCINSSWASWSTFGGAASFKIKINATWNLLFFMRYNFLISKSCLRGVLRFLSVSPVYMFDNGHPELTWTIGPGKWTLYSLAQSKTIQRYTVIGGGQRGILRGNSLNKIHTEFHMNIGQKLFLINSCRLQLLYYLELWRENNFFLQNNDTK